MNLGDRALSRGSRRTSGDVEPSAHTEVLEWPAERDADLLRPRHATQSFVELPHEADDVAVVLILRLRQRDVEAHHVLGEESWIDMNETHEAANEQARTNEQHDRERGLGHDEHAARPLCAAAGAARAFAQHLADV